MGYTIENLRETILMVFFNITTMPHSYNKIWLHVIFSTKDRIPLIHPTVENKIFDHMRNQLLDMECPVRIINGMPDHVHLLFLQNPAKAVTEIVK
jgi:putative transposase